MKKYCIPALMLLVILILPVAAQESTETPRLDSAAPLTPEDLYQIALRHNPDYLKSLENRDLSGVNELNAWGSLMPAVSANYGFSQTNKNSPFLVNPDGSTVKQSRTSGGGFSVQESILLGGQQFWGIKNATLGSRINDLSVTYSANQLLLSVRQNYNNVLAQKQLLALAEQVLNQRKEFLRAAQARFEVGSVTELDVLQAEIDVGTQENAVITAQNDLKLACEELNRTLGIDLDSAYPLVDSLNIFQPAYSLDNLVKLALETRPEYQMTRTQVQMGQNMVKSRRGQFLPSLSFSLTNSHSESVLGDLAFTLKPPSTSTTANLSLNWTLFSGFSRYQQLQQSKVDLNNALHDRKQQQLTVERDVRQALYALQQTFQKSGVTQKNRELASRQLALEQERYRLGSASQLDLRTAQTTYEQAQSEYITNIYTFWNNLAALERAVGKKLR